jgi:hypothetical protein
LLDACRHIRNLMMAPSLTIAISAGAVAGGLMSYGSSLAYVARQLGI